MDVVFEAVADSFGVSGRPERPLFRQPDFSDLLECRLSGGDLGLLLALGLYHRVLSGANERAGLFVPRTGVGQTNVRKAADRQQPFLAPEIIFVTPGFRAAGGDKQIEALPVCELVWFAARLSRVDGCECESHRYPVSDLDTPPNTPRFARSYDAT